MIILASQRGLEEGKHVKVTATELGITDSTFYRWVREGDRQ